jgi:NitT/TauT family transport system ATP-binding protein
VTRPVAANARRAPATEPPELELSRVIRVFPALGRNAAVHALGPVDLSLRRGEFFSIVGPSGCGKSTLLDIAGGLAQPTEGTASFRGVPVDGRVPDGVGVVFQENTCFPWLTVYDNIAFGLRRMGVAKPLVRERVQRILAFMGLERFRHAHPAQLSGGMRQRVAIARTLVLEPSFILLDEPFAALDQQTRLLMGDELLRIWRQTGATILLITHSLDEAAMLSDRIGIMSARPGIFIDIVETCWPQDRDSRLVSDAAFGAITARLWLTLRGESQRALEGGSR